MTSGARHDLNTVLLGKFTGPVENVREARKPKWALGRSKAFAKLSCIGDSLKPGAPRLVNANVLSP